MKSKKFFWLEENLTILFTHSSRMLLLPVIKRMALLIDFKKALYENNRNYKKILDELFKDVELDSNPILFIYYLNPNLGD
jgi:hypothetical protein